MTIFGLALKNTDIIINSETITFFRNVSGDFIDEKEVIGVLKIFKFWEEKNGYFVNNDS